MGDLTFKIDGAEAKPMVEYRGLQIELNNNSDNLVSVTGGSEVIQGNLTSTQFTFIKENATLLNNRLLPGALGAFWGVPLEINKANTKVFDGYIDLTKGAVFECDKVTANIAERKQKDWLNDIADGISFYQFETEGLFTRNDFIRVPYILSEIPNYREVLLLSVTSFVLTIELNRTLKDLNDVLADLSGVFTTFAGVLKLIYLVVYLGLLIIALLKLAKQIADLLIQPVKYHYAMSLLKHFQVACAYLNFNFSSSYFQDNVPTNALDISGNAVPSGLWKNAVWMPRKTKRGAFKFQKPKEKGYFDGTFGDFLRTMITDFNAKVFIIGNTLHFERADYKSTATSYQIPNVKRCAHGINADEFQSNILIEYRLDTLDLNTITRINGNNAKNVITHVNSGDDGTQLISGLLEVRPNHALGRRKNELTEIEVAFELLFKGLQLIIDSIFIVAELVKQNITTTINGLNKIIKAINTLPGINIKKISQPTIKINKFKFVNPLTDRIGMLALSGDITGEPKILYLESTITGKIHPNAHTILSAENIWNKYYFIKSFVPTIAKPNGNQYYIWSVENVPFCLCDFEKIRGIGFGGECQVTTPDGNEAKIISILWNIWTDTANITYGENKLHSHNFKQQLLIDTGE